MCTLKDERKYVVPFSLFITCSINFRDIPSMAGKTGSDGSPTPSKKAKVIGGGLSALDRKSKSGSFTGEHSLASSCIQKNDEVEWLGAGCAKTTANKKREREKARNLEAEWGNNKAEETSGTGSQNNMGSVHAVVGDILRETGFLQLSPNLQLRVAKSPRLSTVGNTRAEKDNTDLSRPDGTATWQNSDDKLVDKLNRLEKNLKNNAAEQESKLEMKVQAEGAKVQANIVKVQAEVAKMQAEIARVKAEITRVRSPAVDLVPECPVCLQQLLTPKRIVQCLQGHKICEVCSKEDAVMSCPTCKTAFMGRDFGMEAFVRDITGKN